MKNKQIYLSPPTISKKEIKLCTKALKSGWISTSGSYNDKFTHQLELYFKKNILLTNSGTSALHLALIQAGVKENDYVLCSNFTFAASAFPILYQKAIPIFIGIEKETWNISAKYLEESILQLKKENKKPKALIIAYCYGVPCNIEQIITICNTYNITVIEDAAEALGSFYKNKPLGSFGTFGIISFNGNKIITTSSGGCLIANKENITNCKKIAAQAKENKKFYFHKQIGYNYLPSNILSAIGLAQFKKLDAKVTQRRDIFNYYKTTVSEKFQLKFQKEIKNAYCNRWLSSFILNNSAQIQKNLTKNNIETRKLWNPLTENPVFKNATYFGNKHEYNLFISGLSFPSGNNLKHKDLDRIIKIIKNI